MSKFKKITGPCHEAVAGRTHMHTTFTLTEGKFRGSWLLKVLVFATNNARRLDYINYKDIPCSFHMRGQTFQVSAPWANKIKPIIKKKITSQTVVLGLIRTMVISFHLITVFSSSVIV